MNGLAREVKKALAQDPELAREAERMFPARGKGLKPLDTDEISLDQSEMTDRLPEQLARKVKSLKKRSLADRLGKTVREFAGKSASSAKEWVEETLGGGLAPQGAPAIRSDATEVEEGGKESAPEKPENNAPDKDQKK